MLKIFILFKKIDKTNTRKKSCIACIIHGKIHDYVVKVVYMYRVRVCDTRTRLKYTDFSGFQCMRVRIWELVFHVVSGLFYAKH